MPLKIISKLIIVHLETTAIIWLNAFPPSKPGAGFSSTKGPGKIFLGNVVKYKKVFCLQTGKYVQVHQEDEPWNTINIYLTVVEIILGTQYNLQGDIFLDSSNSKTPPTLTLGPCQHDRGFN